MSRINFKTHSGEVVTGDRLKKALKEVAEDSRQLAYAIYNNDEYAHHVTDEQKQHELTASLIYADSIEFGYARPSFCLWQRINEKLTGECVAFLP